MLIDLVYYSFDSFSHLTIVTYEVSSFLSFFVHFMTRFTFEEF